jgi:inhibitor of cysteine peptidase
MKKRAYLYCGLVLVCLVLAVQPAAAKVLYFDQQDNGRVIDARVNDLVIISLAENPTTGFMWDVQTTDGLTLKSNEFKRPFSYPPKMGAGGVRTWNYVITGAGTQEFSATYHPAWMPAEEDDQHYDLIFDVRPAQSYATLIAGKSSSPTATQLLARYRGNSQS